ncbi:MAG: SDR family oxidoreductase [Pseudomonadota bacterium]
MTLEGWHDGRVAIVTGGGNGIGLSISRELLSRGATVVVGARSLASPAAREALTAELGKGCIALGLDVSDPASVAAFAEQVAAAGPPPGILVNNAGVSAHARVSRHDDADWTRVIDINLTGSYRMIRHFLPAMLDAGWGRIVNIASTAARTAVADHAAYCASKAGLLGLTRAVALEGAPRGVTCIAVSPTWVETDMLRQSAATMGAASGRGQGAEIAGIAASNPQNRLVQPREVARVVSFVCSDAAPALTMEDIQVNAGALW